MAEQPNMDYIRQLAAGAPDFQEKLLGVIREEFPRECSQFRAHIEQADYGQAAQLVHKLKHKFSILGLEQGYRLANAFEEDLGASRLHRITAFNQVLDRIAAFLDQQV